MSFLSNLSGAVLRKAADLKDKIQSLEVELAELLKADSISLGVTITKPSSKPAAGKTVPVAKKRKGMSAAGKAKIAAAQKTRWAKVNAAKAAKPATTAKTVVKPVTKPVIKKKQMSAAGRAKIAAAAKARWAKVKAEGKSKL